MCAVVLAALAVLAGSACGSGSTTTRAPTLRLPFALGSLAAQGMRVAAAPAGHSPQLGPGQPLHGILWDAATHRAEALRLPHLCAVPSAIAFADSRVAVLCDESCCSTVDQRVVLVRPGGAPVSVMHVTSALGTPGGRIDGFAGGGYETVFTRDTVDGRGRIKSQALYRIDGTHAGMVEERRGPRIGRPLAVARNRILVEERLSSPADVQMAVPPSQLRVLRVEDAVEVASSLDQYGVPAGVPEPPLLFDGHTIYGVDFFSNALSGSHSSESSYATHFCTIGPGATLGGVSGHLVTYTTADAVHVIRMTDCRDALVAMGAGVPVGSAITPAGLFYAFNARPAIGLSGADLGHIRSTLTFVPIARVEAAVARGLSLQSPY